MVNSHVIDTCVETVSCETDTYALPTYVVYHSGLVNFRSEIALSLYSQISPFYRKTSLEGLNLVSKMDATKWNTNSHLEYSVRKNRTTIFRRFVAPGKVVFHTFQQEFLWTFPSKSWKKTWYPHPIAGSFYETSVMPFKFEKEFLWAIYKENCNESLVNMNSV